jgi:hypothetical protein
MKKPVLSAGVLALFLLAGAAIAATPGTVLRNENLYSQPSASAAAAASVNKGANVTVLAKQGGWLKVTAGRTTGWVRLLSVRVGGGGLASVGVGDVLGAATTRSDPSKVVAVAGLRGLSDEELKGAKFNAEELARLDSVAVTPAQAKTFAAQGGLASAQVKRLPKPQADEPASSWGDN